MDSEHSVGELGGDIAVFNDVRNALGNAMEQIEGSPRVQLHTYK